MSRAKYTSFTIALLFVTTLAMGQRVKERWGNFNAMQGLTKFNVKYDYSDILVGTVPEKEYVEDKKQKMNDEEAGTGDKWAAQWVADRAAYYEPEFEKEFNHYGKIKVGNYPGEKFTLVFKPGIIQPGVNFRMARKNAYMDAEIWIVETNKPSRVYARLTCENCPGITGYVTDQGHGRRLQVAYGIAGRELAEYFTKYFD